MPGGDEAAVGIRNAAEGGSAQGAAAEILASTHEGALLLRALASPAAETMIRIPGKAADWVASVLCGALRRAIDSQLACVKKPTVCGTLLKPRRLIDGCGCYPPFHCESLSRVRRLMRMRRLPVPEKENPSSQTVLNSQRRTMLFDLLETYVAELENTTTNFDRNMLPAWTDAQQKKLWAGNTGKLLMVASNRPKLPLESGPEVPRDESTMLELCRLVAVDVDDAERCAQTLAVMRARALHAACPPLQDETLALTCCGGSKSVASPGPSGWRNTHVQAVARARGGMQLSMQWVVLWAKGQGNARPCRNVDGSSCSPCGLREMRERRQESQPDESFGPSLAQRHS